jgi:hypothetical protein
MYSERYHHSRLLLPTGNLYSRYSASLWKRIQVQWRTFTTLCPRSAPQLLSSPFTHILYSQLQLPYPRTHHGPRPVLSVSIVTHQYYHRQLIWRELEHGGCFGCKSQLAESDISFRTIRLPLFLQSIRQCFILRCEGLAVRKAGVRDVDDGRYRGGLGDDIVVRSFIWYLSDICHCLNVCSGDRERCIYTLPCCACQV